MKKFLNEFREFAMRGNVLDMAIGVIIGSAFGKITTSLVNDVFMPLVGLLSGGVDLGQLNLTLKAAVMDGDTVVKEPVTLGLGTFLSTVIDFILVAFVIFLMVKGIKIDPEALDPEDVDMLQDMIVAAVNQGLEDAQELASKRMSAVTGGMNIPGLF